MADQTPATHIEDLADRPIDVDAVLSDDDLAAGGLAPIQTWARTKSSKNAQRIQKARAKAEAGADGKAARRQLNITAPADDAARDALKAVSDAMLAGDLDPAALRAVLAPPADPVEPQPAPAPVAPVAVQPEPVLLPEIDAEALELGHRVRAILKSGGLRARILRRLI